MPVCLVHSYKGGSGKSLFSLNTARLIAQEHQQKVLLIEADFSMPTYTRIFQNLDVDVFFNDFLNQDSLDLEKYIYSSKATGIDLVFASDNFRASDQVHTHEMGWFLSKTDQLRKTFESLKYEWILVDLNPGFHFFTVTMLPIADLVTLIIRGDYQSHSGISDLVDKIYKRATVHSNLNFHLVYNQIVNYKPMKDLLEMRQKSLLERYSFLDKQFTIYFNEITAYNTSKDHLVLPEDDPTLLTLRSIVPSIFHFPHN